MKNLFCYRPTWTHTDFFPWGPRMNTLWCRLSEEKIRWAELAGRLLKDRSSISASLSVPTLSASSVAKSIRDLSFFQNDSVI